MAQFFCGMASVTANSRMTYVFSRNGALPGSRIWRHVNPRTGTPTNSIWLYVVCSTLLVVPSLWNTTAYLAATSIAVIGLYIGYVAPVLLRRLNPDLRVGPWNLGRWSAPVGWLAIVWVANLASSPCRCGGRCAAATRSRSRCPGWCRRSSWAWWRSASGCPPASGSPSLAAAVADVQLALDKLLAAIPVITRNLDHSDAQHTRIVDAILAGDPAGARDVMEEHCEATAELLRGLLG